MFRAIPLGGDNFTKELSRHFQVEPEEAESMKKASGMMGDNGPSAQEVFGGIARQLAFLFEAYQRQLEAPPVESLYLTGGSSALAGIEDYFSKALSLPCEIIHPLEYVPHSLKDFQTPIPPQMATAMGLAIGMSLDSKRERGNFRKDEFALKTRFGMTKTKIAILVLGPLIFLGLLFADFFIHLQLKEEQLKKLNSEIRSLFLEAFPRAGKIPDEVLVIEMQRKIEEAKSKGLQLLAVDDSSRSINLLREVSLRIPMSLKMVLTELEIDRQSIRAAGETDSFENIDKVKESLIQAPFFDDFKLLGAKQNPKTRLIEFRFKMGRK